MMKKCSLCKVEKDISEFTKDKRTKSGFYSKCKICKNTSTFKSIMYYKNSEHGQLQQKVADMFSPSGIKKRGFAPAFTKDEIKKAFYEYVEKHGRNCFYCREPWTYVSNEYVPNNGVEKRRISDRGKSRAHKIKNFSIDRLDSSKTYSLDNIIFCCAECNLSKKDISIKLIKRLYEIITERNL